MKKAVAIFFATLILISSGGVTLAAHFCGGSLAKTAVFWGHGKVTCGMESSDNACQMKQPFHENSISKTCCHDAAFSLEHDGNYESHQDLNPTQTQLIIIQSLFLNVGFQDNLLVFKNDPEYSPKGQKSSFQILFQTFLI